MIVRARWGRRAALAAPLAALALLAGATTASAHSYFVESDPADGSILARAPAHVTLVFSSAVSPDFTSVELVEAHGRRYPATAVVADRAQPAIVTVGLPPVPDGSYRLAFSTRDRVDLHATAGSIVFGVGMAPGRASAPPEAAPARPSEVALRWLALAGLAGLLGGLVLALLVTPRLPPDAPRARVQRALLGLALAGTAVQLAGGTGLLLVQAAGLGPGLATTLPRLVTGSEYGGRWLAATLLGLALLPFVAALRRRAAREPVPGPARQVARLGAWGLLSAQARTLLLALALTAVTAVSGHAAGAAGLTASEVLLRALHLLAMGVWAGGVVAVVVALVALRRAGASSWRTSGALVTGFGPYAAAGLAGLAVTGLLLVGAQVATVTALLSTPYGLVLLAKVGAAALVAAIALRHALLTWRRLTGGRQPRRAPRALLATVALEGGGALGLVLLAAVLGSSAPARGPRFEPQAAPAATQVTRQSGELLAAVSLKPGRQGPNLLSVHVVDTRRPPLAPVDSVAFVLRRPGGPPAGEALATTRTGARFDAGSVDLATGDVDVAVVVHRPGLADTVIDVPWRVAPPLVPPAPVVVSDAPMAPLVDRAAALVAGGAVLVLVAAAVLAGRRRRERDEADDDDRDRAARPPVGEVVPASPAAGRLAAVTGATPPTR